MLPQVLVLRGCRCACCRGCWMADVASPAESSELDADTLTRHDGVARGVAKGPMELMARRDRPLGWVVTDRPRFVVVV